MRDCAKWGRRIATLVFTVAVGACGGGGSGGGSGFVHVVPVSDTFAGSTYEGLSGDWWNWCASMSYAIHPVANDPTGAYAALGQDGPVWFLAGTFGGFAERTVTIPAGKAIFFPLVNTAFWLPEDAPTLAAAATAAADMPNKVNILECEVDGVSISDLYSYRIPSGPWLLDIPALSIFTESIFGGYAPGVRTAMGDGYWIFLEPLSPGTHTIHLHGGIVGDFDTEALYHITVE